MPAKHPLSTESWGMEVKNLHRIVGPTDIISIGRQARNHHFRDGGGEWSREHSVKLV